MTELQFLLFAATCVCAFAVFACLFSFVADLPRWADKAIQHLKVED